MAKDQIANLQKALMSIGIAANDSITVASLSVAKEAVKMLKSKSKSLFGNGDYAKGWTYKKTVYGYVIYNKEYQLTHLLENGHDIVVNGQKVGYSPAKSHIKEVDDFVQKEFEKEILEDIEL